MKKLWEKLGKLFYAYGKFGASIPSIHGSYEAKVPDQLQK